MKARAGALLGLLLCGRAWVGCGGENVVGGDGHDGGRPDVAAGAGGAIGVGGAAGAGATASDARSDRNAAGTAGADPLDGSRLDSSEEGGLDGDASGSDGGNEVTATVVVTYVTDSLSTQAPLDLTGYAISALVFEASGTVRTYPPTVTGLGAFKIPGVPQGEYYLRFNSLGGVATYVITSQRSLDLGFHQLGRADAKRATAGTKLVLNVTGLNAWQDGDDLTFWAGSSNASQFGIQFAASSGAPPVGATQLAGCGWDYAATLGSNNLIEGTKGDFAALVQQSRIPLAGSESYLAVSKLFNVPPFTLTDGQTTTINGQFEDVSQSYSISIDWKISEFVAAATSANPGLPRLTTEFSLSAQPEIGAGLFTGSPALLAYTTLISSDLVTSFSFGRPFERYGLLAFARHFLGRSYQLAGTTTPATVPAGVETGDDAGYTNSVTLRPLVGGPTSLTINGQAAAADLNGVGTRPTITWTAPSGAAPAHYIVRVSRLFASGMRTQRAVVANIYTKQPASRRTGPDLSLPEKYFVSVTAISMPGTNVEQAPFRQKYPLGRGTVHSGIASP